MTCFVFDFQNEPSIQVNTFHSLSEHDILPNDNYSQEESNQDANNTSMSSYQQDFCINEVSQTFKRLHYYFHIPIQVSVELNVFLLRFRTNSELLIHQLTL